jgi:(E)-4-hydroxy-3-methyl-but-2-enyl pyrophosphate reductase
VSVKVSRTAGFCMGVKKAMEKTLQQRNETEGTLFTLGPLIHNPQVLEILKKNGVLPVEQEEVQCGATVIIRAHGVTPDQLDLLKGKGCVVINATCPRVAKVQGMAKKAARDGKAVVIVGDRNHAEVRGILGYSGGSGVSIASPEEARTLALDRPAVLVAQTTFSEEAYDEIAGILKARYPDLDVQHTICDATSERQQEARRMAADSDALVVVGGRTSANTRRLVEIVSGMGTPAFLVEDETQIPEEIRRYRRIGVTAGASTPNWLINRVAERLVEMQSTGAGSLLWRALAFLVRSNLLIGFSALALTYLSLVWQRLPVLFVSLAVPPLYLFGIHVLNSFSESRAQEINEPAQKIFMQNNRPWLMPLAGVCLAVALVLAFIASVWAGMLTFSAVILGLSYQVRLPVSKLELSRIPCSKDLFTAAAWAIFTCWIPALALEERLEGHALAASGIVFGIILIRAIAYDVKDLQGDRMVGKETIPIYLGRTASRFLGLLLIVWVVGLLLAADVAGTFPFQGWLGLLLPAHTLLYLWLFRNRYITGGIPFSVAVDGFPPFLALFCLALAS